MLRLFFKSLVLGSLQFSSLLSYHPDEELISNIEQLTSPAMGFQKAGEAYFSPDGKMISFQAVPLGETGYQIYTMDLTTKEVHQISQNAGTCTCSYFHPNGKKILFAASPKPGFVQQEGGSYKWDFTPYMNIYEADLDGSNPVALTQGPAYHAECAYSPDGSHIVYASNEDGSMNIYVMRSDGSDVQQITHTDYCYNGGPFFSPDGKKIVFRADRSTPHYLEVYVMDRDGSDVIQVTDNQSVNWAPYWHPSHDVIAYTTSIHGHHCYEIYLLSLSTNRHHRVTHYPRFDGLSTFNQEGNKMLWTSKRGEDNTSQVFIADFKLPSEWSND